MLRGGEGLDCVKGGIPVLALGAARSLAGLETVVAVLQPMDTVRRRQGMASLSGVRAEALKLDCKIEAGEPYMDHIHEFIDQRQKSMCIHCRAWISEVENSADHVPSKSLLRKPYPAHLPVMKICMDCNNKFSNDEEYMFLFMQCVLAGTTDPERHSDPKVGHAFYECGEPTFAKPAFVWSAPLETMSKAEHARFAKAQAEGLWPEVGSRMMTRVITGQNLSDGWVVVQDGVYRYSISQNGGILVKTVLYEYLAAEVYWNEPE